MCIRDSDNTTFTYAVALEGDENQVEVTFSKGKYNLSDVEAYIAPVSYTHLDVYKRQGIYL